jgi:hypothetical protein
LPDTAYIHKMDHRDQSDKKSQWLISTDAERECFVYSITARWNTPQYSCWGLHFEGGKVSYLGVTAKSDPELRQLFIAKFIDSNKNDKWHGYPADACNEKQQDIPPEVILKDWLQKDHLRPQVVRKLTRGQKCKL